MPADGIEAHTCGTPFGVVGAASRATEFAPLPMSRSPRIHPVGSAKVSVPELVTGEFVTTKPVGAANPTEDTPPPPPPPPPPKQLAPVEVRHVRFPVPESQYSRTLPA